MEKIKQLISNCLWYDSEAEEAALFYVSIFTNSKITHVTRFGKEGFEIHGKAEGSAMTVEFELNGQQFVALNGGPKFKFNEAMSLMVNCLNQEEIDYYWDKLSAEGEEGPCGWLKDKFGLSWQVIPIRLTEMLRDADPVKSERVMNASLRMKKFDLAKIEEAYRGIIC